MDESPSAARSRRFRLIILAPIFALIALACWSLASPIGASPDDDYHLDSIWCGLGDRAGICQPGEDPTKRIVPTRIRTSPFCFRRQPEVSAACQADLLRGEPAMSETYRGNFTAIYPPVYYTFMSLFVSPDLSISTTVVLLRVINVVIFLAMTCCLYLLLPFSRRHTLVWMWTICVVPLGAFLLASNNPSAWAIISGGSLWLALIGYFESVGWRKIGLGAVAVAAAVMGAGARADSAVYVGIAATIAVLMTAQRTRRYWVSVILPLLLVLMALAFFLASRQSGVPSTGFGSHTLPDTTSPTDTIRRNILGVPELWAGVFGAPDWGLGWLYTTMPGIVWVAALGCFAAVVFAGLRMLTVRKSVALGIMLVVLWAIPTWILVKSNVVMGQEVQPRYLLPLVLIFAGLALLQVGGRLTRPSRPQVVVLGLAVSVANAVALHVNIRRYVSGTDVTAWNLDFGVEWWWGIPVSPMAVWAIGAVAFAAAVAVALWHVSWRPVVTPEGQVEAGRPMTR